MNTPVEIDGQTVHLANPDTIPQCSVVGRKKELDLCRAAWAVSVGRPGTFDDTLEAMHFRLEGPPGVGKNEIIYQLARELKLDLYIIPGHEEMTPEDLALVLVPDPESSRSNSIPLIIRASPLATALYKGGLVFFDEINRVPERTLSPLASVLDGRKNIFSAFTGIRIKPADEAAANRFRFCCALNPLASDAGHVLPEYIAQRTLPAIEVLPPSLDDLLKILETNVTESRQLLDAFSSWYKKTYLGKDKAEVEMTGSSSQKGLSVRQAKIIVNFAGRFRQRNKSSASDAIAAAASMIQ